MYTARLYAKFLLVPISTLALVFMCLNLWSADTPKANIDPRAKPPAPTDNTPRSNIRVDANLVLINVTVTDPLNRFVTGLEKDNFRLFEDKSEQKLSHFASEDATLSVGLVFDTSGSMGSKLSKSRQAVTQFFKTANPQGRVFPRAV